MPDTRSDKLFAQTPVGRLFLRAAIPGAVGMLISSAYDLLDGVLVGTFLGSTSFAAVNLAMPFIIVAFGIGDLVGSGSAVPIAIHLGKGDTQRANEIFSGSVLINVVSGLVMALLFVLAAPAIMTAMGATGRLADEAALVLRIFAAFLPLTTNMYAVDNFLRISGQIRRSFLANLLMAVLGAILELVLFTRFHCGIWASAFSYSLAMVVALIYSLIPFVRGKLSLRFTRARIDRKMLSEIVRCGMPIFLENVSGRVFAILMNAVLLRVGNRVGMGGENAVSIYGVLLFSGAFVMPLIYGAVDSLQPAVGYNWGAKRLDRVKAIELLCFASAAAMSLMYVVFAQVQPEFITRLFLPDSDPEFLAQASRALRLYSLAYLLRWVSISTQGFMVAVGQTRLASFVSVVMAFVSPFTALLLLRPLGLEGLWLNALGAATLTACMCVLVLIRFRKTVHERVERA